jgi:hypothetical protein
MEIINLWTPGSNNLSLETGMNMSDEQLNEIDRKCKELPEELFCTLTYKDIAQFKIPYTLLHNLIGSFDHRISLTVDFEKSLKYIYDLMIEDYNYFLTEKEIEYYKSHGLFRPKIRPRTEIAKHLNI